jgi:phenylacetate-CoA ligase
MYERLYSDVDLGNKKLTLPQMLTLLPIISKADLLSTPLEDRLNRRYAHSKIFEESTTGSTGQPFSLFVEESYKTRRNVRFLRGLISAGYRPWQRLMLLTDRYSEPKRVGVNRYYEPVEQSTSAILDAYRRIRPHVLYGFLTPLRLLAERLVANPQDSHQPHLVISTAEMLDRRTRRILENAFGRAASDFYGLTEMGLVARQQPDAKRYIMSPNSVLTELIPAPGGQNRYRMIMTNLDLRASPIIRFDSGDLAGVRWVKRKPHIVAIEGRRIDTIVNRNGEEISPYRITDALRDVAGLRRFKVTQRDVSDILVELEVEDDQRDQAAQNTHRIFDELLGKGLDFDIQFRSKLVPDGTRKFRPVESLVGRP